MKDESKWTIVLVALFVTVLVFGSLTVSSAYQYRWNWDFAQKHLDVALAMSDPDTQELEISKAIDILQMFPKEGNSDPLNKNNPTTDMSLAWKALYQLKDYSTEWKVVDKNSQDYQLVIYNTQEKISHFKKTFRGAFVNYYDWTALSTPFYILSIVFFMAFTYPYMILRERYRSRLALLSILGIILAGIIFFFLPFTPILYFGPV